MHGDTQCRGDTDYQAFRAQVHNPEWQRQFLAQPLNKRRAYAAHACDASKAHTSSADMAIMDVTPTAVSHAMTEAKVPHLIHGHTHRPAVHEMDLQGVSGQRIVLGDWYEQGSLLQVDSRARNLRTLPADKE